MAAGWRGCLALVGKGLIKGYPSGKKYDNLANSTVELNCM